MRGGPDFGTLRGSADSEGGCVEDAAEGLIDSHRPAAAAGLVAGVAVLIATSMIVS